MPIAPKTMSATKRRLVAIGSVFRFLKACRLTTTRLAIPKTIAAAPKIIPQFFSSDAKRDRKSIFKKYSAMRTIPVKVTMNDGIFCFTGVPSGSQLPNYSDPGSLQDRTHHNRHEKHNLCPVDSPYGVQTDGVFGNISPGSIYFFTQERVIAGSHKKGQLIHTCCTSNLNGARLKPA